MMDLFFPWWEIFDENEQLWLRPTEVQALINIYFEGHYGIRVYDYE